MGMQEVFNEILRNDSIVIFGHRLPDGDCYGSQIALKEIIKKNFPNKKVYIVGSGNPEFFNLLGKMDTVSDEIIKKSLGFLVDMAGLHRSEDDRIYLAKCHAKIDHHIDESHFQGPKFVDEESVAACQLIFEFALKYNLKITKKAAEAIFLGIVTDSGRFQYQPMGKRTFLNVAKLFDYGLRVKYIYNTLYSTEEKLVKYQGYMTLNYEKTKHNVIYLKVTKELYERFGLTFAEVSNQVNTFGGIKNCPLWLLFTENDSDGTIRVEYRSNDIDVQQIALKFGGGGHINAAGSKISKEDGWKKVDEIIAYCDHLCDKLA